MNESWQPVWATGHGGQSELRGVEGGDFMASGTAPDKALEERGGAAGPALRIVAETSKAGARRERYATGKDFTLGVERERQRDGLRNELYAEVLAAQMDGPPGEGEWKKSLEQILRVVEAVPVTALKGRVYVCNDGEIGIAWGEGSIHIEVSVGASEHVEYLVLDENAGIREESVWMIESGDPMPATLSAALEGCP